MTDQHLMTKADFARHLGVSDSYVSKLDRQNRLVKDSAGLIVVAQSKVLIEATRDPGRGGDRSAPKTMAAPAQDDPRAEQGAAAGPAPAAGVMSYNEAARREKVAKALTAELEQAETAKALVRRDVVERAIFGLARTAMEALRSVPPRIAGVLATTADAHACERIVEQEILKVIRKLAKASVDGDSAGDDDESEAAAA